MIPDALTLIQSKARLRPQIGLILGTGLGGLAERLQQPEIIPYAAIPGFPESSVEGHANRLLIGQLGGRSVAAMQGRAHFYEGYSPAETAFPVRVLAALGVNVLIVSNAAGGLNPMFAAGDLMLIADHIYVPGLAGHNPLRGPNDPAIGPRFPDMNGAYDPSLRLLAHEVAASEGLALREGVYAMVAGPSYETPAECRYLLGIGADAVGMSTCPEVVVARHAGLRVLGISLITNAINGAPISHEEVLATATEAAGRFSRLVEATVSRLSA